MSAVDWLLCVSQCVDSFGNVLSAKISAFAVKADNTNQLAWSKWIVEIVTEFEGLDFPLFAQPDIADLAGGAANHTDASWLE